MLDQEATILAQLAQVQVRCWLRYHTASHKALMSLWRWQGPRAPAAPFALRRCALAAAAQPEPQRGCDSARRSAAAHKGVKQLCASTWPPSARLGAGGRTSAGQHTAQQRSLHPAPSAVCARAPPILRRMWRPRWSASARAWMTRRNWLTSSAGSRCGRARGAGRGGLAAGLVANWMGSVD